MKQRSVNDDYIVRVYRRSPDDPRLLVGTVERVGVTERRAFGSIDELWAALIPSRPPQRGSLRRAKKPDREGSDSR